MTNLKIVNQNTGEIYEVKGTDKKSEIVSVLKKVKESGLDGNKFYRKVIGGIATQVTKTGKMYATEKQINMLLDASKVEEEKAEAGTNLLASLA